MSTSASNSVVPSSATADAGSSAQTQPLGLFKRPEFIAGIDDFRKHFGLEVRSKTTEGYTFLGLDKPVFGYAPAPPNPQDKPKSTATKPLEAGKPAAAAAETSPVHGSVSQAAGPASQARGARAPAKAAATGSRGAQRESESTLDHLMSFIKPSPPASANTATLHAGALDSMPTSQKHVFVKTVVMSQVRPRLSMLATPLPAHINVLLPSFDRLAALQLKLDALHLQQKLGKRQEKQPKGKSEALDARDSRLSTSSRSSPDLDGAHHRRRASRHATGPDPDPEPELDAHTPRKRPRPDFKLQIRVPKKARQRVLDAIATVPPSKRARKPVEAPTGVSGLKPARRPHGAPHHHSPVRTASATRPSSESRPRTSERGRGGEPSGQEDSVAMAPSGSSRKAADIPPSEVEQLRRLSARLEAYMRSFKHSGDAEHAPRGKKELELAYYLESLACCLEDFWCRSAFNPPAEMRKKWPTMLGMCQHLHRECNTRELSPLRGCAALITACVHYRLSSAALEMAQESVLSSDVAKHLADMERCELGHRQLLSAFELSRQFPQTWKRCQISAVAQATYEPRSCPMASKWPSVAYPVGATSNPMDVANFVRQLGDEWLGKSGLALKTPSNPSLKD